MTAVADLSAHEPALELLKEAGNPFRNYFARNPDDDVCARYHVAELFARERSQLLGVVDLYRQTPQMPCEMVPILGNKGAGKTHLLHSIKHGSDGAWQLLVTPGTYQKDSDFMEYLLFQVIDTLLGGGKQKGRRPLEYISEELGRRLLLKALTTATPEEQLGLFPSPALGWLTRKLGLGSGQAQERTQWLVDNLSRPRQFQGGFAQLRRLCAESHLDGERASEFVCRHIDKTEEEHNTAGLMRRHLHQGFARAAMVGDESELANFLTYGFAELEVKVQPTRQDLVLSLFKVLLEVFQSLNIPVVAAFDQLEDLLLARRADDGHRTAEAFFAGIVQAMHQLSGVCFLVFAERGLWNRFIPSLDGYIQDRLNNPVHVPGHGTVKALRLEAPPAELVRRVTAARLSGLFDKLGEKEELPAFFPFTEEQVDQVARTEPTLRDMLQQFRHLFDHLVYGEVEKTAYDESPPLRANPVPRLRIAPVEEEPARIKSVVMVETPANSTDSTGLTMAGAGEAWDRAMAEAQAKLGPEGSVTGATRELQAGLGSFLRICHEHGVKVGPWRLQHVVPEWSFGEHPTYGVISIAHWVCKDGQPWKVGVGLFLGRGAGKPKDLEIKLSSLEATPPMIDHLILLRPDDDLALTGKSKTVWQDAEKRGRHARLEPVSAEHFTILYGFPRWLTALGEDLPAGQPLPNLADLLQERCEKLLEQVCMPCP
ncbi:MAG: hypothetical protein HY040_08665 [Planctomycetes bacterium]|nr:hypothetical protein [Planctomycetota bacterium]